MIEDGLTFEANARKKAEHYSKYAEGELVIADDSGLEVDALQGAPGVRSARYAADEVHAPEDAPNSDDEANNARLLRELAGVPDEFRTARFVCLIAVARNGHTVATFHGKAEGIICTSRAARTALATIRCFSFPRSIRPSPSFPPQRRRNTATAGRLSVSFSTGPSGGETNILTISCDGGHQESV